MLKLTAFRYHSKFTRQIPVFLVHQSLFRFPKDDWNPPLIGRSE